MLDEITADDVAGIREARGWSQTKLASHLGCNQSTVWRMENGGRIKGPLQKALLILRDEPLEEDADELLRIKQAANWIIEKRSRLASFDGVTEAVISRFKLTTVQAAHAVAEAKVMLAREIL